jgi:hypothetical protein
MGLQSDEISDLVKTTLPHLGDKHLTEIAPDLQKYVGVNTFFGEKMRKKFSDGRKIQWNVLVEANNSTVAHGKMHEFESSQHDGQQQAEVPWTYLTFNWNWEHSDILENRTPSKIVDYLRSKERAAYIGFAEAVENYLWAATNVADDDDPRGIPYWVTKNATAGFTGGILSSWSDVAGLSPTTYSRWNNYAFPYTEVTGDDFIENLSTALRKTDFTAPFKSQANEHGDSASDGREYMTNNAMLVALERFAKSQNDNLGPNIVALLNGVMIGRREVMYVPKLDEDTTNPFYGLHTGVFKTAYLAGMWDRRYTVDSLPMQPHVGIVYNSRRFNWICYNRSKCFVGSNGTTYPS